MIIKIDDKLSGKDKRKQIMIQMVSYAMSLHPKSRVKAAEFLGYSEKGLRLILNRVSELKKFKGEDPNVKIRIKGGY